MNPFKTNILIWN